jgi:hypothetical protein
MINNNNINNLFELFDELLGQSLEIFIAGGSNLLARGINNRVTLDIDVICPENLPEAVMKSVQQFAQSEGLSNDWLNTTCSRDLRFLDKDWKSRAELYFAGKHLRVWLLGRKDMLALKLAAAVDRGEPDYSDIIKLKPTKEEWAFALEWAKQYDGNPDWPRAIEEIAKTIREAQNE